MLHCADSWNWVFELFELVLPCYIGLQQSSVACAQRKGNTMSHNDIKVVSPFCLRRYCMLFVSTFCPPVLHLFLHQLHRNWRAAEVQTFTAPTAHIHHLVFCSSKTRAQSLPQHALLTIDPSYKHQKNDVTAHWRDISMRGLDPLSYRL